MKRVPAKTPRPFREARGIKFQPVPVRAKPKVGPAAAPKEGEAGDGDKA